MPITKDLVLKIIKYLLNNPSFYFPFEIVCFDFVENNEVYVMEISQDSIDEISSNNKFQNFALHENLQDVDLETLQLMSKGFIEKITTESAIIQIEQSANEYRKLWKLDLCESTDFEEYGLNEFLGGKAEGFEEALEIIRKEIL